MLTQTAVKAPLSSTSTIKPTLNFENFDYTNHTAAINSPRSVSLMRESGILMQDLYFYNFYEYREMHPEIIPLSLEIQKSHFYHMQGIREDTLRKLIQERRDLIHKEETKQNNFSMNRSNVKKEQLYQTSMSKCNNTTKSREKEIEKCKEKQKKELLSMVETQLRDAFMKQQNELKFQLEKEMMIDRERENLLRRKEEERYKAFLEQQRKEEEKRKAEEQKKIYAEYYRKEQEKRMLQEQKEIENKKKIEEKEKERQRR